ncbi:MAG: type I restriction-modification system subunit M [Coriobacteriales bacterium]|nr:type I restriction-modification system subunit M [Coriobacteriales bacterium]
MNKQQLAAKIWASANEMRSKIEASEYKDYILGFIFYKFLSEKEEAWLHEQNFEDADMPAVTEDDPEVVAFVRRNIGYFIAYDHLYSTWLSKGADFDVSDVTDALSAFSRLVNPDHKHVFDRIFETLETGLSKLGDTSGARTKAISGLLHLIKDIPMDGRQGYDVLGYIYEYLISNFAANAGKKAGEFYTPHEVSVLMSQIVAGHLQNKDEIEIYDPTSGSGSLLINIGQAVAARTGNTGCIKYYAQELKENTYNLTRMNLVMRGIKPDNITTRNADTLADDWPYFEEGHPETYEPLFVDACVSNPPYSQHWDPPEGPDPRFDDYGLAPKSKADYAFLLHDLYHLQPSGIMCIVLPHGVLFRGGEEGQIRRNLIENNNIDAIIGLPVNIFFGTGIPTIIMVLRKQRDRDDVLIIDASKGFVKEGKNNKLRASDIRRIVDAFEARTDIERFCRVVSKEEIRNNDYNLNIPRYVDSSETSQCWDIYATMFGGIPTAEVEALHTYWDAFPGLAEELFDKINPASLAFKVDDINKAVREAQTVRAYCQAYNKQFCDLEAWLYEELVEETSLVPRDAEESILAAEIFSRLKNTPLIDRYDAYQVLDDEWNRISVDLEVIQTEGFSAVKRVDPHMVIKKQHGKDAEVQDGWIGHILPFDLVQRIMLTDKAAKTSAMEERLQEIASETTEILENFTDDEKTDAGDAINEAGDAFVASKLKAAIKTLKSEAGQEPAEDDSLLSQLERAAKLFEEEAATRKQLKIAEDNLIAQTKTTIESLSDDQACELLSAKWIDPLVTKLLEMPNTVINEFIGKLKTLHDKYDQTYAAIDSQIQDAEKDLVSMLGELTGNEYDMAGIQEFANLLGGDLQ